MRAALILATLLVSASVAGPAQGDWEVKRRGNDALLEQALRTLQTEPDQPGLAARIVRLATRAELAAAIKELTRAAERAPDRYQPREALAQLLLAAGRPAEAAASFAQAMTLRPQAPAPAVARARALTAAGQPQEALAAYDEALRREQSPAAQAGLWRAVAALAGKTGDNAREITAREKLAGLLPSNASAALELAEALRRGGDPARGAEAIERLAAEPASRGRRAELLERAASLREEAGDDEAAERLLRECLTALPAHGDRSELYRRLSEIARRRDTLPALAASLEKQVAAAGARAAEWAALARVREDLGDLAGALEAARRAAALDPADLNLRRQILGLLQRLGREAELMAAYDEIERRWPDDATIAIERIDRRFRAGEREEARALFDRALRTFRRSTEALANLADLASRWSEDDRVLAAWDAVLARSPRDERAIVGLGEAHFQRGRRELARRTWRGLLTAVRPRAAAHARLAELLGDHELVDEAVLEARAAQKLEPNNPHHRRTLARILERKKDFAGAMAEWRAVLAASQGPTRAAERREARSSLINLLTREGRGRLDMESVRLAEQLARHPDDRETILFLAEVEMRRMDPDRALQTLRAAAARRPDDAEIIGALVRLLRQSRHLGEAIDWLEKLAARSPERARDAYVQIAEMELQRYADVRALHYARLAEKLAADDPDALARIGEIEERAGQTEQAITTYRRSLERGPSGKAAAALHRLLVRRGAASEAAEALRTFVRTTTDEEARADLLRSQLDIEEYLGTLPAFEKLLVSLPGRAPASRKVAVALLQRVVPRLYRQSPGDAAAAAELERAARWGVRPLVELVTEPEVEPDPALIELMGMLGNRNATPVLIRLLTAPGPRTGPAPRNRAPLSRVSSSTAQVAAAIALGRLGDGRATPALVALGNAPDAGVRAVALWALGRIRGPAVAAALETAAGDPRNDVAAIACLGLGRLREARAVRTLAGIATDLSRHLRVRRAAALGLGLAEPGEAGALLSLLDSPDPDLARAAAVSVGAIKDRRTLGGLWERALLGRGPAARAAVLALRAFAAPGGLPDEARHVRGARFDVDALLEALSAGGTGEGELEALWSEHAAEVQEVLGRALQGGPEIRRRALEALDAREAGVGLGPLTPPAPSPPALAVLQAMGERLRDRVAALLDDPDPAVRRLAVRLASKLRDPRLGVSQVQALVAGPPADGETAALLAVRVLLERGGAIPATLVDALREPLADASWERRLLAVRVLRMVGAPARSALQRALGDPDPFVRAEAAEALGQRVTSY